MFRYMLLDRGTIPLHCTSLSTSSSKLNIRLFGLYLLTCTACTLSTYAQTTLAMFICMQYLSSNPFLIGILAMTQFTLCQSSGWSLTDQPAGSFCLAPPWFHPNHVEFTKTSFLEKNMIFAVTIQYLRCSFFTDTTFKGALHPRDNQSLFYSWLGHNKHNPGFILSYDLCF